MQKIISYRPVGSNFCLVWRETGWGLVDVDARGSGSMWPQENSEIVSVTYLG